MENCMRIHTVKCGESLSDIAKEYSVDKETIIKNNGLGKSAPRVGEELLVLIPTRTYRVQKNDTVERIALRFGLKKSELLASNPDASRGIREGDLLVLHYGERRGGMAATLGTLYGGYERERLISLMPYLTYVALGAAVFDGREIRKLFDTREAMDIIGSFGKIPLLRIYCKPTSSLNEEEREHFAESLAALAGREGYSGIVLSGAERLCENVGEAVAGLREKFLGKDLILITELSGQSSPELPMHSDGSVVPCPLSYCGEERGTCPTSDSESENRADSSCCPRDLSDSREGERAAGDSIYKRLSAVGDSAKCFIELPSFAKEYRGTKEAYLPIEGVCESIRKGENTVTVSADGYLGVAEYKGGKKYELPTLSGVKEILESLPRLGFMGIAFDIMRCPVSYIMMFNSYFKAI